MEDNKAFHEKFSFAFPLLSDVDKSMTKAFDTCKPSKDGADPCAMAARSTFLVGADGALAARTFCGRVAATPRPRRG